jgi:D-amino-acid dehydrogenase
MSAYAPMNRCAHGAFDALAAGGVAEPVREAGPFLACHASEADQKALLEELLHVESAGQRVEYEALTGAEARGIEPALSEAVGAAVRIHGQRFVDAGQYLRALGEAVSTRGGDLREGASVRESLRTSTSKAPTPRSTRGLPGRGGYAAALQPVLNARRRA